MWRVREHLMHTVRIAKKAENLLGCHIELAGSLVAQSGQRDTGVCPSLHVAQLPARRRYQLLKFSAWFIVGTPLPRFLSFCRHLNTHLKGFHETALSYQRWHVPGVDSVF
jgi:hypothetical protein